MDFEQTLPETTRALPVIDIFVGPIFTYLTPISNIPGEFGLMKVEIPSGVRVPIHSHADREIFYILSGELEELTGTFWQTLHAGDVLDVTAGVSNAIRNLSGASMSLLLVTTLKLGQFFLDVGRPTTGVPLAPPTPADLPRFAETSQRNGYWMGSPEDNEAVGIMLH